MDWIITHDCYGMQNVYFDISIVLSETFLILTRTERDAINVHRSSSKIAVILARFNET